MSVQSEVRALRHNVGDFGLALGVFRMPFAWLVLLMSLAGSLLVFAAATALVWWLATGLLDIGWLHQSRWDNWLIGGVGSLAMLVAGWFIFPVLVTAVAGLFLEPLADRIERLHYPDAPAPRQVPVREQILSSVRTLVRALGWNLLGLPLYFIPLVNLVAYAGINGFLLSREYFQVVALRHVGWEQSRELYRAHRPAMLRAGLLMSVLFVVPLVNLSAPLLATAWMVHRCWCFEHSPLRGKPAGLPDS